jgi:hypothetical protein
MEVGFQAVADLIIKGSRSQLKEDAQTGHCLQRGAEIAPEAVQMPCPAVEEAEKDAEVDLLMSQTVKLLDNLDEQAHELPSSNKQERSIKGAIVRTIEQIKESITSLFSS